jgi:hypothetical protein
VWGNTSVRICSVRLAVTTISVPVVCASAAPLVQAKTANADAKNAWVESADLQNAGVESASAKRRAPRERFFI